MAATPAISHGSTGGGAGAGAGGAASDDGGDEDGEVVQLLRFCEVSSRWALARALEHCSFSSSSLSSSPQTQLEVALALRTNLGLSNDACVLIAEILTQPSSQ